MVVKMAKTIFLFGQPLQSNKNLLEVKIDEFSRQYSAFSKMVEFSAKRHGKSKKWWESEEEYFLSSAPFDMEHQLVVAQDCWPKYPKLLPTCPAIFPFSHSHFNCNFNQDGCGLATSKEQQ